MELNNMSERNYKELNLEDTPPIDLSVKYLCEHRERFFIPAYQRGYKWGKNEIVALLDDIQNFDTSRDGDFYCLQPIVVRKDKAKGEYRVIDGQQRLTTLYIILKYSKCDKCFDLDYERETKLICLNDEQIEINYEDSESFHISSAYDIIQKWANVNDNDIEGVIRKLDSDSIRFIWYNLPLNGDEQEALEIEHAYFMNLNSGKISLTEAELIKALLLHNRPYRNIISTDTSQIYMAEEWDRMERSLRQPDMWHFIAGKEGIKQNAMDYLVKLLWDSLEESERKPFKNIDFPIFAWAERTDPNQVWNTLVRIYRIIRGWYEDCEFYNIIGYFASGEQISDVIPSILRLLLYSDSKESKISSKKELLRHLWIRTLTNKGLVCSLNLEEEIPEDRNLYISEIHKYRYDERGGRNKIFNILLLANIAFCTLNGISRKFDFLRFNSHSWNVEHISPANPKSNTELMKALEDVKAEWGKDLPNAIFPKEIEHLSDLLNELAKIENEDPNDLTGLSEAEKKELTNLREKILPATKEETMSIDNFTLLTELCNKGIGNRFFFDKRQRLQQYQSKGEFIPILTLHVFTKWYSKINPQPWFWDENDRKDYLKALDDCIMSIVTRIKDLKVNP